MNDEYRGLLIKIMGAALAGVAQLEHCPVHQSLGVEFLVRAHT